MRPTIYTTQVFSLFGGVYLPEYHDPDAPPRQERSGAGGKWPAIICGLLIGATTAAGALTAVKNINARPALNQQSQPTILLKLPGGFGVDDALY
jgi:hypothetical protein